MGLCVYTSVLVLEVWRRRGAGGSRQVRRRRGGGGSRERGGRGLRPVLEERRRRQRPYIRRRCTPIHLRYRSCCGHPKCDLMPG